MSALIECVPNFSEGHDLEVIRKITARIESVAGATLLHFDPGKATNRTVVTFAGFPDTVVEAAFRAITTAAECMLDGPGATPDGVFSRVDIYDPVANRWRAGPPLPTPRHGIFPLLAGDRVNVLGGSLHTGRSASSAAEILDLIPLSSGRVP